MYVLLKMVGFSANHVCFQGSIGPICRDPLDLCSLRPSKGQVDALLLCASTDRVFAIKAMGVPPYQRLQMLVKYTLWVTKS